MRIYINTDGRGAGGPQRWAARFIAELRQRGFEVTHDADSRYDAAYFNIDPVGIEDSLKKNVSVAYRVAGCNIPEWFDIMGKEMKEEHRRQNDGIRRALEISTKVIYQSAWAKSQLDQVLFRREADYAIIHNGVSRALFRPSNAATREPVIVSAGNLRYRFRLLTLFEVSKKLDFAHSLLIAGPLDDECQEVLKKHLDDPAIGSRICYAGDLSEPEWAEALKTCDIMFHPVCGDWCPNVVVEALMSGVPVITPRFGGTGELLGSGGIAFECEPWVYGAPAYTEGAMEACRQVFYDLDGYKNRARLHAERTLNLTQMTDLYLKELGLPKQVRVAVPVTRRIKSKLRALSSVWSNTSVSASIGYSFVDLALGGAQVFYVDLIERLAKRGHKIRYYLFASEDNETLCDNRLISRINQVAEKVSIEELLQCSVIHLDGYHTPAHKKRFLAKFNKCVETFHSEYSFQTSGPIYSPNRVVISKALKEMFPSDCDLIYYGIDTDAFASDNSPKDYDLAILGRIHPAKNHLLFLDVCRLVARDRPIKALIIGGYPWNDSYEKQVRDRIEELRAEGVSVDVTGFVSHAEVPQYLDQSRILLVTSPSESFGRMAAEALACEVPVIANSVGGLTEIVKHGRNGYLAKYNDPEDFARLTVSLLSDDVQRKQMGCRGRRDVIDNFSVSEMVKRYEHIYKEIKNRE